MFLVVLFVAIIPWKNNIFTSRILGILWTFVVFVIQPLFYFNGDVNFRNRVLQQGLCRALKREFFQTKEEFQKVKWFCRAIWILKEFCTQDRQNIDVKVQLRGNQKDFLGFIQHAFWSRNYWSWLDHHLLVSFGEKAKIKKAGNLN